MAWFSPNGKTTLILISCIKNVLLLNLKKNTPFSELYLVVLWYPNLNAIFWYTSINLQRGVLVPLTITECLFYAALHSSVLSVNAKLHCRPILHISCKYRSQSFFNVKHHVVTFFFSILNCLLKCNIDMGKCINP